MNKVIMAMLSFCLTFLPVFSFDGFDYNLDNSKQINSQNLKNLEGDVLEGHVLYVPYGVTIDAVLSSEINSNTAVVGQTVNAILINDFIYNGIIIAPEGSVLGGSVVKNKKAGYGKINAQTKIVFTTIRTPYGNIIPINASIFTTDLSGVLKGGTKKDSIKEYAKDGIIAAGSGAILGTAMGAIRGNVGRGTLYGTAIGAGMSLVKTTCERGKNVLIPSNSQVTIYFNQPITLNAQ